MLPYVEHRYHLCQTLRLFIHGQCSSAGLFHQGRILLGHLIEVAHCLIHLREAIVLLIGRGTDLANQVRHAAHAGDNGLHALARLRHLRRSGVHIAHTGRYQRFDLFGRLCAALGQRTHLARHHGKATALLTGTGGFHRCIERQDIGLKRNAINHTDDVGDFVAAAGDLLHAAHHLLHHMAATLGRLHGRAGQLIGLACGICRLRHRGRQLFNAGGGFFQVGGGLLRAPR